MRSESDRETYLLRQAIENEVQRLIDLLDLLDPDPDFEPDNDDESYLASCRTATGNMIDLEQDDCDMEPDDNGIADALGLLEQRGAQWEAVA